MLETTLATTFVPGTNLKGKVAGANWLFLLPSLRLMRVVCIGLPQPTTLPMLSALSEELVIVTPASQQAQVAHQDAAYAPAQVLTWAGEQQLPLPDQSVDLLLIADQQMVRTFGQSQTLNTEVMRLLTPHGLLYYEYTGRVDPLDATGATTKLANRMHATQHLWLTPLSGEMHTAVPVSDQAVLDYFRTQGIYTPSINRHSLKQTWQRLYKPRRQVAVSRSVINDSSLSKPAIVSRDTTTHTLAPTTRAQGGLSLRKVTKRAQSHLRTVAKRVGRQLLQTAGVTEAFLSRDQLLGATLQRRGVLRGQGQGELTGQIPAYLQQLAQADGIALGDFGWGLAARGDYSSRKLLFFLFDRRAPAGGRAKPVDTPTYVVKMVRDPIFNARLENEAHALRALAAHGVGDRETLPQVVFAGQHAGLAVVGETAVEGAPFRQRTHLTADCPYASAAITWFTELAVATATPTVATSVQVAETLQLLLTQFEAIYQLSPQHHAFLAEQIAILQQSQQPFPLVFQHGDPGTWNMLVTPNGRVAILDWEAAEAQGMPLWDLFYFIRSYAVGMAQHQGMSNSLSGFREQMLTATPLRQLVAGAIQIYRDRIGLASDTLAPLFYTCWVHRALKEATRLAPARVEQGHYVNLLRLCIDQQAAVQQLW